MTDPGNGLPEGAVDQQAPEKEKGEGPCEEEKEGSETVLPKGVVENGEECRQGEGEKKVLGESRQGGADSHGEEERLSPLRLKEEEKGEEKDQRGEVL